MNAKEEARQDHARRQSADDVKARFNHYYRECPYEGIDVYRVLKMFDVTDPCLQHALKKLLVAGGRGNKDIRQDVSEVISSLVRWQAMRAEEIETIAPAPIPTAEAPFNPKHALAAASLY